MKSLLKCMDRFFFGTDDEQENEIKPYFYVALLFGMIMALVIVVKLF